MPPYSSTTGAPDTAYIRCPSYTVLPTAGSQVNDPQPPPPDAPCAEAEDDDELCGTTTFHEPASPSVAFTCVWLVSDWRVTSAVPVLYPAGVPAPAGGGGPGVRLGRPPPPPG